jgi:hypothetical protein
MFFISVWCRNVRRLWRFCKLLRINRTFTVFWHFLSIAQFPVLYHNNFFLAVSPTAATLIRFKYHARVWRGRATTETRNISRKDAKAAKISE